MNELKAVSILAVLLPGASLAQTNSPAYQSYLELLKNQDSTVTHGTYACFEDNQQNVSFRVVYSSLIQQRMIVETPEFKSGVLEGGGVYSGNLNPLSSQNGLFATLTTMQTGGVRSKATDTFEWGPDVLSEKVGFGPLAPGQVRTSYEFKMQRSTGRYVEHIVFAGIGSDGWNIDKTGKCIRIPNTQTPEEEYLIQNPKEQ